MDVNRQFSVVSNHVEKTSIDYGDMSTLPERKTIAELLSLNPVRPVRLVQNSLDRNRAMQHHYILLSVSVAGDKIPAAACHSENIDVTTSTNCLSRGHHLQPKRLQVSEHFDLLINCLTYSK